MLLRNSISALAHRLPTPPLSFVFLILCSVSAAVLPSTDVLIFGDAASEQAHGVEATQSEIITGGLSEPARRLLAPAAKDWQGGRVSFNLKVDPEKLNYATVRLWGSDTSPDRLILYIDGKQIGYRHLGDIEVLDIGDTEPAYNERFFYRTTPLPMELTRGKTQIACEIRSTGPIWGYGTTFDRYQLSMTQPTRGLYRIVIHPNGFYTPPEDEKQGSPPATTRVRPEPGIEVLDQLKKRVSREITQLLASEKPLNQMQLQFLAKAYFVKWTPAYQNPKVVKQVIKGVDALFVAYRKDPKIAQAGPATYNPEWFGLGPVGDCASLLAESLHPFLEDKIPDGAGATVTRRAAWSEMLCTSRDWHCRHRRLYTNQTMINDLYIFAAHRGIAAIDPERARPDAEMLRYLYESVGLQPWRDSDPGGEGAVEMGGKSWGVGDHYWQLTAKGLTKELGYVGYYGEVLDWVTQIYDVTRPKPGQPGDPKIKAQLEKMAHARAVFRYPMLDAEGYRAMRIETVIGWRDVHYPGEVCYGERISWDGSALYAAAATLDPEAIGYAQQLFADNQFFATLATRMKEPGLRVTAGLLGVPDQYETLQAQKPNPLRLPMTSGQPDFVFTDEEDGVVALKQGDEILYASLYWRARYAINFRARVHYLTPRFDRIAVVREETLFEPSGLAYTQPDWTNLGFGGGGLRYPESLHSAHAGETLPIAKIPEGVKFTSGDENVYAGRGSFYTLRYGPYLIGMNCTTDQTHTLACPADLTEARDLVSGKNLKPDANHVLAVGPRSTVVLRLEPTK